jgi:hypothetical protein
MVERGREILRIEIIAQLQQQVGPGKEGLDSPATATAITATTATSTATATTTATAATPILLPFL